jgi:hypothetical protein
MRSICTLTVALLLTASSARAQAAVRSGEAGRRAVASDSVAMTIAEAETRGSQRGAAATTDTLPAQQVPFEVGGAERRCVDVGSVSAARSGDFVVRGFSLYGALWYAGYGKLAWFPEHAGESSPPRLVIRATRLDAATPPQVFETYFSRGQYWMYPTGIHLPTVGRWMLVGAAGDSWGCFVYTLASQGVRSGARM